jgi:hypothetical protein
MPSLVAIQISLDAGNRSTSTSRENFWLAYCLDVMSTLIYDARFRPIRMGWCIRAEDTAALKKAFRLNQCFWGGRFNPIIVVDDEKFARRLIEKFQVDALFPVSDDQSCRMFVENVKHLPWWPIFHKNLFEEYGARKASVLLDIYHPVRKFYEEYVKDKPNPDQNISIYRWNDDDQLANVFEATFGNYPNADETGIDYRELILKKAAGKEIEISPTAALDKEIIRAITPNVLSALGLTQHFDSDHYGLGLFVGEADSFSHLVEFWNLRAAGVDLFFFDPRLNSRFGLMIEELNRAFQSLPPQFQWGQDTLELWLKCELPKDVQKQFTVPLSARKVDDNWDDGINPPSMYLSEHSVVAQISEGEHRPTVTLQIGEVPGFNIRTFNHQLLVVTLKPTLNFSRDDRFLFTMPFIPELNDFYGREHSLQCDEARAERDGLGIITSLSTEYLTLFGVERFQFAKQFFKAFGIAATVRQPGLVCDQLIKQMGGLLGCRTFKIAGVRKLIEQFKPTESFTRSTAMKLIGNVDPTTGRPNFSAYENLYLEPRNTEHLTPDDVFTYLLRRGVFRVGLKLKCTDCQLEFWRSLDDVKAEVVCEYCGQTFNTTPQLKERDWAYRLSGLFGRDDHQEGGVPVALTLQQLDRTLGNEIIVWLPAMNLDPTTAVIEKCETDFALLIQSFKGRVGLVIGECKANGEITDEDVRKLSKVADAFPPNRLDVFIVFAKTSQFTAAEIERCRTANSQHGQRIILLSERELEPYSPYERAEKEFSIEKRYACSLMDMVEATRDIYFQPKRIRDSLNQTRM